jgi:hypothetical protein
MPRNVLKIDIEDPSDSDFDSELEDLEPFSGQSASLDALLDLEAWTASVMTKRKPYIKVVNDVSIRRNY